MKLEQFTVFLTHTVQMKPPSEFKNHRLPVILNPHGSDETNWEKHWRQDLLQFLTHTVQMKHSYA